MAHMFSTYGLFLVITENSKSFTITGLYCLIIILLTLEKVLEMVSQATQKIFRKQLLNATKNYVHLHPILNSQGQEESLDFSLGTLMRHLPPTMQVSENAE